MECGWQNRQQLIANKLTFPFRLAESSNYKEVLQDVGNGKTESTV
jgi:hypothetical protein